MWPADPPMPILTDDERVGTFLGADYAIESILGRGGMGTIFAAKHLRTGRSVAVKILHPQHVRDPVAVRRFLNEARAAATFSHPNVVEVLDVDQLDDQTVFMVLAKLDGESLGDLLDRQRVLPLKDTVEYLLPIMRAIAIMHHRGVVHRDIKPDNIFLARNDGTGVVPTLLDFGIAKTEDPNDSALQTMTGTMIGTPQYMAPEQATDSKQADHLVDLYALGVVWFECLAGQRPVDGASPAIIIGKLLATSAPKLRSVAEWVPEPIATVIDSALEFDRDKRTQSVDDFIDQLIRACEVIGLSIAPATVGVEPLPKLEVTVKIAAVRASIETLKDQVSPAHKRHARQQRENPTAPVDEVAAQVLHKQDPARPTSSPAKTSMHGLAVALVVAGVVAVATIGRAHHSAPTATAVGARTTVAPTTQAQTRFTANQRGFAQESPTVAAAPPATVAQASAQTPLQTQDAGSSSAATIGTVGLLAPVRRLSAVRGSLTAHGSQPTRNTVNASAATTTTHGAEPITPLPQPPQTTTPNRPPAVANEW